ncbi:hypothetical protein [Pseudomarimonas arenosa]|uniref:Uncharacterized protein n=1 Tax=Pseudomarimonas arenosa TaxID=2774145 RepID=A0AAW3ZGB9_9GAMM|nr:hypothetical protein [Pseudomarimonas arenosa]MBD8525168.1 hypothetical protein [Pseudomarimonas arenosa]
MFSVSRQTLGDARAPVEISAAARAMAGVSGLAAGTQLQMFVQYVGAFGGNGRSFAPFSPIQSFNDRFAVADAGQAARSEAAEAALVQQAAAEPSTASAASAVAAYRATAPAVTGAGLAETA